MSCCVTATVPGSPVNGVSVVASNVCPRQGRANRCPLPASMVSAAVLICGTIT